MFQKKECVTCVTDKVKDLKERQKRELTIPVIPLIAIKTGASVYIISTPTYSIDTWVWKAIVEFWEINHFKMRLKIAWSNRVS